MGGQCLLLKQFLQGAVLGIGNQELKRTVDLNHSPVELLKILLQVTELVGSLAMSGGGPIDKAGCTDNEVYGHGEKRKDSCGHTERVRRCGMKAEHGRDEPGGCSAVDRRFGPVLPSKIELINKRVSSVLGPNRGAECRPLNTKVPHSTLSLWI